MTRWAELVAQAGYCHHPIRLAGRVEHADRQTGEVRTGLRQRAGAGRGAVEGVRHPPGVPLPVVCGHLPGRRLPAPGRRAQGRQGRPRDDGRASAAVRDLHRPQLRPGPHPQGPGAAGAALSPVPAGCPLPAWHPGWLLAPPRRGRPSAGGAALPGLLRRPGAGAVERPGARAVATDHHRHPACPRPAGRPPRGASCAGWSGSPTPRWPSSNGAGRSTSTPSSAWTRPPTAAALAAWPHHPSRSPPPSSRTPCGRRSRPSGCPARLSTAGRAGMPAGVSSSTSATSPEASDQAGELSAEQVAGYIAKYATKATESFGAGLDRRLDRRRPGAPRQPAGACGRSRPGGLGAGRSAGAGRPPAAGLGAHAGVRRPLVDQEPPLLDHLHASCAGPGSPSPSAAGPATVFPWTPGAGPRTTRP